MSQRILKLCVASLLNILCFPEELQLLLRKVQSEEGDPQRAKGGPWKETKRTFWKGHEQGERSRDLR